MARDRNEWGSTLRQNPKERKLPITDLPRGRHMSTITPTSRSVDMVKPSSRARQLVRANITERQTAREPSNAMEFQRRRREVAILYSSDFTPKSLTMVIRDATPTELKQMKHTKMDRRDVLTSSVV
ncbi:unnamed protein product [Peronospora destructor]|uniref:Uncharacterized protein n=1 Tax=Peronospora destructor TaxID=86335 RepID=A0AAV0VF29_9STRA|nr:unnamed protein product [Peronospora destructor]